MSRSGYDYDGNDWWAHIRWRGAVNSAIKGKRGQAFIAEILKAMDDMQDKRLIKDDLEKDGAVCAIGAAGKTRGIDMSWIDPEDYAKVAQVFGVSESLAREIVEENDQSAYYNNKETDEERFQRMYKWLSSLIKSNATNSVAAAETK